MRNSTSSSCSFAIAVLAAVRQAVALSLLVAFCPRMFIKSTGHVAARRTKRADHPRRRILFCSSTFSIEKSRWRRALLTVARNICADISYCTAVPNKFHLNYCRRKSCIIKKIFCSSLSNSSQLFWWEKTLDLSFISLIIFSTSAWKIP